MIVTPLIIFLAGRDRYTQRTLLRDVFERLKKQPGCEAVRYHPTRRRPRYVHADIDTTVFLGRPYSVTQARLELRFWYPPDGTLEYYRCNWIEADRNTMLGFHRDDDHHDLGPCHLQLDHDGTTIARHAVAVIDDHPLAVLETRLHHLSKALDLVTWNDGCPSLSDWPS